MISTNPIDAPVGATDRDDGAGVPVPASRWIASDSCQPRQKMSGKAGSNDQLFLSVFLNLMAFFAVLVAISDFEENKIDAAIGSIREVFGQAPLEIQGGRTGVPDPPGVRRGGAEESLKGYLERLAQLRRIELGIEGEVIRFSFEPGLLFDEPRAVLLEDRNVLLVRLANLMRDASGAWLMKLRAHYPLGLSGDERNRLLELLLERLGVLADDLLKRDIEPASLTLELIKSERSFFEIELRPNLEAGDG